MAVAIILVLVFMVGIIVWYVRYRGRMRNLYVATLNQLAQDPNNGNLRMKALRYGREAYGYSGMSDSKTVQKNMYIDQRINSEINAITGGR